MGNYKVVVVNVGYESFEMEKEILRPIGAELYLSSRDCLTEEDVIAAAHDADAILVREAPISANVLNALERCKIVARYGVGVDNIDLEIARKKRIYVSNVPDYCAEEVSDHAVALLLACVRTIVRRDKTVRQGKWETDIQDAIYRTTGRSMGLIGYGRISRVFHRKWKGFLPSKVFVHDPYVSRDFIQENGGEHVDLDTLFSSSDYISLHLPLTSQTHHLVNENRLKSMKKTAILVNTARGGLIDEKALEKALLQGWISGAGLDVFEHEPLSKNHPLKQMDNVVITSHVSWYSKDSGRELQSKAAQEVFRVLSDKEPVAWVNPW
jgi:D-3-phosphoglycerate dehydrogenase